MPHPLLVTLVMDEDSFAHFDGLRKSHFPPERNHIPAHITLFHALPAEEEPRIRHDLAEAANRQTFPLLSTGVWNLGRGVAYRFESQQALAVRAELAVRWHFWLTPQDRNRFSPHITVQNKTTAEAARRLFESLQRDFIPCTIAATGLQLWRYLGGPWESLEIFPFRPT